MAIVPEILALRRLDPQGLPLQEQLYARVRRAIVEGQLSPGQRLPSSRALAGQLGVARGTVDAAYARLAGEGYVLARGPAGTVVSPNLRTDTQSPRPKPAAGRTCAKAAPATQPHPFQPGLPALDMFPRGLWARLTGASGKRARGRITGLSRAARASSSPHRACRLSGRFAGRRLRTRTGDHHARIPVGDQPGRPHVASAGRQGVVRGTRLLSRARRAADDVRPTGADSGG